jgi:Kef-type K+ transport system membrane component KefB
MLVPLAAGVGLAAWFLPQSEYWPAQALFLAVALSITAVPVAVRVLMDLGKLNSTMGRTIVSAAVVDDALSLVLLAVLTAIIQTGSVPEAAGILRIVGQTILFFVLAALIGQFGAPLIGRVLKRMQIEESDVSALLIAALAYALLAEMLGVHFILGAFLAGLFFGRRTVLESKLDDVRTRVKGITTGFFAPIFFTSIGLHLSGQALIEVPLFVLVLIAAALFSKLVGAGVAAWMTGSSTRSSLIIGTAMSSRGAVELIIADIALRAGLFDVPTPPPIIVTNLFSAVIIMAITTTIVAPIVMRRLISRSDASDPPQA